MDTPPIRILYTFFSQRLFIARFLFLMFKLYSEFAVFQKRLIKKGKSKSKRKLIQAVTRASKLKP